MQRLVRENEDEQGQVRVDGDEARTGENDENRRGWRGWGLKPGGQMKMKLQEARTGKGGRRRNEDERIGFGGMRTA